MKKNPLGKDGDFITSPLVSSLFGEMIAIWCILFWENLNKPNKIVIVELGPGDGTLCKDLLKNFKKFTNFYNCLEINLLEKSKFLTKVQKKNINNDKVKWVKKIEDINTGPIIFIGNEFFDSLPIKQICIKKKIFYEKFVSLSNNQKKIKFTYKKAKKNLIKNIKKLNLVTSGNIIEYPLNSIKIINKISKKIKKLDGGLLVVDYGYTQNKNKDTLQSVKKHSYSSVLFKPGDSDITAHVNFNLMLKIFKKNNLEVEKIVTQSEFLQKVGIMERANILSKKASFREKADMFYRIKKLVDLKEMGGLFKVLFAKKSGIKFSLGF